MGVIEVPDYDMYCVAETRYPKVPDIMTNNCYKLLRNCQKIEPEPIHSIDKQIMPAKTKPSRIRQYNPQKPKKSGFKMFVRAGHSGIMYDFFFVYRRR